MITRIAFANDEEEMKNICDIDFDGNFIKIQSNKPTARAFNDEAELEYCIDIPSNAPRLDMEVDSDGDYYRKYGVPKVSFTLSKSLLEEMARKIGMNYKEERL